MIICMGFMGMIHGFISTIFFNIIQNLPVGGGEPHDRHELSIRLSSRERCCTASSLHRHPPSPAGQNSDAAPPVRHVVGRARQQTRRTFSRAAWPDAARRRQGCAHSFRVLPSSPAAAAQQQQHTARRCGLSEGGQPADASPGPRSRAAVARAAQHRTHQRG